MSHRNIPSISACVAFALLIHLAPGDANAQTLKARAGAKTSVNGAVARPAPHPSASRPAQRPVPPKQGGGVHINQNNQNNNINVNVNVQGNQHGGYAQYQGHDDHHDWDDWDDWDHHPFAVASAVTAGVAVTNAVIGSIVRTVPPQCVPVNVNGIAYQQCGSTWYQPQYVGTTVQYIVVVPPG